MSIEVQNISKTFGTFQALKDVSLKVATGELVALLGPSGSGKTTLLRIIAGLEVPDIGGGNVRFFQEDVTGQDVAARNVGFVFQHYALFRHMTVFENVAFGLRVRPRRQRPSRADIRAKVLELLRLVQLDRLENRYPSQLSGGQRQRVALARALAVEPKVLLLDEPFGALDARVRADLRRWLRKLHDEVHITSVFVTHDQEEALEVADRIAVLNKGKVEQIGSPEQVYDNPATPFVYHFLGNVNLFHGRVHDGAVQIGEGRVALANNGQATQDKGTAYVRPHDVEILRTKDGDTAFDARVEYVSFGGPLVRVQVRIATTGETVDAEIPREEYRTLNVKAGEEVYVKVRRAHVFEGEDYSI